MSQVFPCISRSCSAGCCNYYGTCPFTTSTATTFEKRCYACYGTPSSNTSLDYYCGSSTSTAGVIAGAVVGGIFGLIFLVVFFFIICKMCDCKCKCPNISLPSFSRPAEQHSTVNLMQPTVIQKKTVVVINNTTGKDVEIDGVIYPNGNNQNGNNQSNQQFNQMNQQIGQQFAQNQFGGQNVYNGQPYQN